MKRIRSMPIGILLVASLVVVGFTGCSDTGTNQPTAPQQQQQKALGLSIDNPGIQHAMEVQKKFTSALMRNEGVVGTATGLTEDGEPCVLVLKKTGVSKDLPTVLEGIPVRQHISGVFTAYQYNPNAKGGNPGPPSGGGGGGGGGHGGGGGGSSNPTKYFTRPVPIGVSTGNIHECSAGTIGCRVVDGDGTVYALSNNHVYALENNATIGDDCVQPGVYDRHCRIYSGDVFASLKDYQPISFNSGSNTIDAAIAETTTGNLGKATPSGGYGTPSSSTMAASLNMAVQKYGRTSKLTHGSVYGTNGTVTIDYGSAGTAVFTGQILITPGSFLRSGDSGSLLVTDDTNANPVGLLYAGSAYDAIACPIQDVLNRFNVSIDGK